MAMIKKKRFFIAVISLVAFLVSIPIGMAQPNAIPGDAGASRLEIYVNRIPIEDQDIFEDITRVSQRINNLLFTKIRSDSPRSAVVDFYASMGEVGRVQKELYQRAADKPGLFWSKKESQLISRADRFLKIASESFDRSEFETGNSEWKAREHALKLKDILDVLFDVSNEQIVIPAAQETKSDVWRMRDANVSMIKIKNSEGFEAYKFSSETIDDLDRMRALTQSIRPGIRSDAEGIGVHQLSTPQLTSSFLYSPGGIVPPKAYLLIPESLRTILETPAGSNGSIFGVIVIISMVSIFLLVSGLITIKLVRQYVNQNEESVVRRSSEFLNRSRKNLYRSVVFSAIAIGAYALSGATTYLVYGGLADFLVNTLVVIQWLFVASSLFVSSELVGQIASAATLNFAESSFLIKKRRIVNVIILVSRSIGSLLIVCVFYWMLLDLGFTDQFLLAFSAVPGLAIGLGASKILSNIFAGISLQADRPIKVGEFCQIGNELGFIRNIGLRSIQLETLTGTIFVPNHLLEDSNLTNYTDRDHMDISYQIVEFKMIMPALILGHYDQICRDVKALLEKKMDLHICLVKYGLNKSGTEAELCVALSTQIESWPEYNFVKEEAMKSMKLALAVVSSTRQKVSIGRFTPSSLLRQVPLLIRKSIEKDAKFKMTSCRLSDLKESGFEFTFDIASSFNYDEVGEFFDALSTLRKRLVTKFESHGIDLAIPAYAFRKALSSSAG